MFAVDLVVDLVRDLLLLFALLGQLLVTQNAPEEVLGLADDDVLPRRWRFGRLVATVRHGLRLIASLAAEEDTLELQKTTAVPVAEPGLDQPQLEPAPGQQVDDLRQQSLTLVTRDQRHLRSQPAERRQRLGRPGQHFALITLHID